jgi:transposase
MWPGNNTDVKTLLPIVKKLYQRFKIDRVCIVADRGMISAKAMRELENPENTILHILSTRMRKVSKMVFAS